MASPAGGGISPFLAGLILSSQKSGVAVFVDGCFWHGCPKHSTVPATNRAFWKRKLTANKLRDRLVSRTLRRMGWRVVRIWEHDLRKPGPVLRKIQRKVSN